LQANVCSHSSAFICVHPRLKPFFGPSCPAVLVMAEEAVQKQLLECRNLSVSIGGQRIVDALNLVIGAGQSIGIPGPNGVGTGRLLSHALIGRLGVRCASALRRITG